MSYFKWNQIQVQVPSDFCPFINATVFIRSENGELLISHNAKFSGNSSYYVPTTELLPALRVVLFSPEMWSRLCLLVFDLSTRFLTLSLHNPADSQANSVDLYFRLRLPVVGNDVRPENKQRIIAFDGLIVAHRSWFVDLHKLFSVSKQ